MVSGGGEWVGSIKGERGKEGEREREDHVTQLARSEKSSDGDDAPDLPFRPAAPGLASNFLKRPQQPLQVLKPNAPPSPRQLSTTQTAKMLFSVSRSSVSLLLMPSWTFSSLRTAPGGRALLFPYPERGEGCGEVRLS